jgi:4'-phosphopantetheinyl transferase EntD
MAGAHVSISLAGLFPSGVEVATADPAEAVGALFPEEEAAVVRAIEKRKREFLAGRQCARKALTQLGADAGAIPVLPNRAPGWPEGVVGSITHCTGLAAAAVAWRRDFLGLGLDAEVAEPLLPSLSRFICTEAEERWMAGVEPPPGTDWVKLIFSAKEAVYKCIGPLVGRWVEFREVTLAWRPALREFAVLPGDEQGASDLPLHGVVGRYRVEHGLVLSTASLPNGGGRAA